MGSWVVSQSRPSEPYGPDDIMGRSGSQESLEAVEIGAPAGAGRAERAQMSGVRSTTQRPGTKPRNFGVPVLRGMSGTKPSASIPARKAWSSTAPPAANSPGVALNGICRCASAFRAGGRSWRSPLSTATARTRTSPARATIAAYFEPCLRRSSRDGPFFVCARAAPLRGSRPPPRTTSRQRPPHPQSLGSGPVSALAFQRLS
jgi:hypothetical protein